MKKIQVSYWVDNNRHLEVIQKAERVGLNHVDDVTYMLHKRGSKKQSEIGLGDQFSIGPGRVMMVGNDRGVWIQFFVDQKWWQTSGIVDVKASPKGYLIETNNSFYELERFDQNN